MYSKDFYKRLENETGIDTINALNYAKDFFTSEEITLLWQMFNYGKKTGKIPYYTGGFYPHQFYSAVLLKAKEKNISCESVFLWIYTAFAQKSYDLYMCAGLTEKIFFDSFSKLGGQAKEYEKDHGSQGLYDYHFCANHVRSSIIRLGCFEYGYGKHEGKKAIFIHVPKGADMCSENRYESYSLARKHLGNYPIIADSWMLYPKLKDILTDNSKILEFSNDFEIIFASESYDYKELFHVFGRNADYSSPQKLPADTSLQKAFFHRIKEKLPIGSAVGILRY